MRIAEAKGVASYDESTSQKCSVCGYVLRTPLGLEWLFERVQEKGFVSSGYFMEILDRYGS